MGITHFPGGVSSFGTPVLGGGIPLISGDTYFVDARNGNDSNGGLSTEDAFATLSQAHSACTSNNGDLIIIDGDSTIVETSVINFTKNRITVVGTNGGRMFGQAAKVKIGVTTDTADLGVMINTGVRNNFIGIKFISNNTLTQGKYAVVEAGEYGTYINCEIFLSTQLGVDQAADLALNGDSAQFYGCTIGNTSVITTTAKIRPKVLLTEAIVSGKTVRDCIFIDCLLLSKAGGTAHVMVYGANATDVERMLLFKHCTFLNNFLSASLPAHAVGFGSAQTDGTVALQDCAFFDVTKPAQASRNIHVTGPVTTFATSGLGKIS